ncbi:MAG: AAA family ATPase, partial [Deltaproteobacteria bacterium]|nr:AAA family ATPase [Deltaproteobacteria bacterium]
MTECIKTGSEEIRARPLLLDTAIFLVFIDNNAVMVDKTSLIRDLFNSPTRTFFLSRPRRFGKTLLIDTIKNIAEGHKTLFRDMDIGKEGSGYAWDPYPVIRFSFSSFPRDPEMFKRRFLITLDNIAELHGLSIRPAQDISDIQDIIKQISKQHPVGQSANRQPSMNTYPLNTVLLIDEYDFPLLGNIGNPDKIFKIREMLQEFYSTIKECENMLRLTFITGISKFSKLSIFSGMNNIVDISFDPHYSSICGFTEKEIEKNFHDNIISILPGMEKEGYFEPNPTKKTFMEKLKFWYDGYSWDGTNKVFNPFSVVNCLYHKEFNHYWYDSGTSLASYRYSLLPETFINLFAHNLKTADFKPVSDINALNNESFLFQTGYATIDQIIKQGTTKYYVLKCPNNEISFALSQTFVHIDSPFPGLHGSIIDNFSHFVDLFDMSDDDQCANIFSSLLEFSIPSLHYPDEYTLQSLLFILLNMTDFRARREPYSGDGRPDIVYDSPSGFSTVVEIKYHKPRHPEKVP